MPPTVTIWGRVPLTVQAQLIRIAERDQRSLSYVVGKLLTEAVTKGAKK